MLKPLTVTGFIQTGLAAARFVIRGAIIAGLSIGGLSLSIGKQAAAAPPRIVVDIAPVYSLVAMVLNPAVSGQSATAPQSGSESSGLGGLPELPELIVTNRASPHDNALRPSTRRSLQNADLLFWVGPELSPWMEKAVRATGPGLHSVVLLDDAHTKRRPVRPDLIWGHSLNGAHAGLEARHSHGNSGKSPGRKSPGGEKPGGEEPGGEEPGGEQENHRYDPHAWLDPDNAIAWINRIALELSRFDSENAAVYARNAAAAGAQIRAMDQKLKAQLSAGVQPYIVYHDAFAYFEMHYGLASGGVVNYSHSSAVGARRFRRLKQYLDSHNTACLFLEPGTPRKAVRSMVRARNIKVLELDPIGITKEGRPVPYTGMMRNLADGFMRCTP